jgi:hypothetical protein
MILVETLLNPDGTLNLAAHKSGTLQLQGWNVTLDSKRGPVLSPREQSAVTASADTRSALLNNGLRGGVNALAVSGNDLYVGDSFTQTAEDAVPNLKKIARFSGGKWLALSNDGLGANVNKLLARK